MSTMDDDHPPQRGPAVNDQDLPRCDHICRLDDEHVERGIAHQYGYEVPSPRTHPQRARHLEAAIREVRGHYPEAVFPKDGTSSDARHGTWAREVCDRILVIAKDMESEADNHG